MNDTERLLKLAFIKVLRVNLATGNFRALCLAENEVINSSKFEDWIDIFANEGNVEDEKSFRTFFNSNNIKCALEREAEIKYIYNRRGNNGYTPVCAHIFKSTEWTEEIPLVMIAIENLGRNKNGELV